MPGLTSQNHASLSKYAPPSEPLGFNEEEGLGAEDIFSMCSIMCFIPWRSFLVIPGSSDSEGDNKGTDTQEFHEVATTDDDKHEVPGADMQYNDAVSPSSQPVPEWKRKYLERKSIRKEGNLNLDDSDTSKRSSLEETLDRFRKIDDEISDSVSDVPDESPVEPEVPSTSWSMATFFSATSYQTATSTSSSSSSLYSMIMGNSDDSIVDSSLSSASLGGSPEHEYTSISPAHQISKSHRRQHSPAGVMDIVE